jgi:hypothetical protein
MEAKRKRRQEQLYFVGAIILGMLLGFSGLLFIELVVVR